MARLKQRIDALEGRLASGAVDMMIFVVFIRPGDTGPDWESATADDGCSWVREPGESQDAFEARISGEARNSGRVSLVFVNSGQQVAA